jgi:2-iminobutanoate/2-iminopropanoate deaminase
MLTALTPPTIAPPAANYAHAVSVTGASRWLHTSGVVPIAADGTVASGLRAQAQTVWSNIAAILAAADMGFANIVSLTTYVVTAAAADLGAAMAARDEALSGGRVASTLLEVAALARPEWLMEIAVVAAA